MNLLDLLTEDDTGQDFGDNAEAPGGVGWELKSERAHVAHLEVIVTSAEESLRFNREDLARARQRVAFLEGKGAS